MTQYTLMECLLPKMRPTDVNDVEKLVWDELKSAGVDSDTLWLTMMTNADGIDSWLIGSNYEDGIETLVYIEGHWVRRNPHTGQDRYVPDNEQAAAVLAAQLIARYSPQQRRPSVMREPDCPKCKGTGGPGAECDYCGGTGYADAKPFRRD